MAKQDDWVRLTVRLPPSLYELLQGTVSSGSSSMNAEIVDRLSMSYSDNDFHTRNLSSLSAMSTLIVLKSLSTYFDVPGVDMRMVFDKFIESSRNTLKESGSGYAEVLEHLEEGFRKAKM